MLYGHDEGKNLKQLCNGKDNVICIEMGGTGAKNKPNARQNINFIGVNPIASIEEDRVAKWAAMGTGIAYINKTGLITNQPSQYGFIETKTSGVNVFQTWHRQGTAGTTYKRAGDLTEGWYNSTWVKELDEKNAVQTKTLWENASPTSSFVSQDLDDELLEAPINYTYVLIDYEGINTGTYTETILIKVNESRYLTWTRYPETSGEHMVHCSRKVNVGPNSIQFGQGSSHDYTTTSIGHSDDICVPIRIRGIKGVL